MQKKFRLRYLKIGRCGKDWVFEKNCKLGIPKKKNSWHVPNLANQMMRVEISQNN
jgi:hypothetical protein